MLDLPWKVSYLVFVSQTSNKLTPTSNVLKVLGPAEWDMVLKVVM